MKRLVSTLNLPKEDWLRYRKSGITGTDAGAILGLNPYRSAFQVYHDKISDTIENMDNEAMKRFVKCFFELLTQIIVKVRKCKVQRVCVLHFQLAGSGGCFFLMKLYH